MTYVDDRQWRHDPWDDPDITDALVVENPRPEMRRYRWVVWALAYLGLAGLVVVGLVGLWYTEQVNPEGDPGEPITFTVDAEDTVHSVAVRMHEMGLISSVGVFEYYVDDHGGLELTPGYYVLRPDDHMGNVMRILRTPPSETYTKVTFPEGYTYEKMGLRLQEKVPRLSAVDFNLAATDGSVSSVLLPEGVTNLEGLLFPDTYQVSNSESAEQLVQRMVRLTERVAEQEGLTPEGAARFLMTPYQVLIVASMIEREAGVDEDRAKIARVIYNRLALGMPLQIDATLYYGQDGSLPFSDLLAIDTPYNTYLYTGLPPTPIANPGRASIEAALNPAADPSLGDPLCVGLPTGGCHYLFYVLADEDGRHVFAVTAEQHLANVEESRRKGLLG